MRKLHLKCVEYSCEAASFHLCFTDWETNALSKKSMKSMLAERILAEGRLRTCKSCCPALWSEPPPPPPHNPCAREDGPKTKQCCVIFCLYQTRPPQLEMHYGVGLAHTLGRRDPTSSHREASPAKSLHANEASAQ